IGVVFFLKSDWIIALMLPLAITQLWRAFSETLRADYRGGGRISTYQFMAIVALVYSVGWVAFLDAAPSASPNILTGLSTLANSAVIVFLESLWIAIFLYMGCSSVTAARLSFHVVREKI